MWYKKLHWQIVIGLFLGLIWGLLSSVIGWNEFTSEFIQNPLELFLSSY